MEEWRGRSVWEIVALIMVVLSVGAVLSLPAILPFLDEYFTPYKREPNTVLIRAYIVQHGGYEPKIVKLKKGEKVKIVVEAMDLAHGFAIDELGINIRPIVPGDLQKSKLVYFRGTLNPPVNSIEFVANKTGIYAFRTSVINSPMAPFEKGYIIVEGER